MDLNKLYKLQEKLDNYIWKKHKTLEKMTKEELLDSTILALLVEVAELANATRCFKHWSTKGPNSKVAIPCNLCDGTGDENYHMIMEAAESNMKHEYIKCEECKGEGIIGYKNPILEELADVWHFYLSIGNQIHFSKTRVDVDWEPVSIVTAFKNIYYWIIKFDTSHSGKSEYGSYLELGNWIIILWRTLGFTNEEVEQAYMKKHKENYRRQEEGY